MEYRQLFSPRRNQKQRKVKDDLDYFREAARYYYQMGDDKFVIRVGKKKLAIGNEQKKLLALYLAASLYENSGEIRRKVADFPAFKIFESTFKECAIRRDISDDVISGIVSQEFSELFKLNRDKGYNIQGLIVLQTKRVADANEVNPLYWMCKTSDNVNGTNFAEKFVDNINWFYYKSVFYYSAGRQGGLSEKPWERSDIEKMVSIEKSSILGMLFGNGTSTKRVRQETEPFQQDRKNGAVEHRKLNKEAGAESKRVAEFHKSFDDHLRTMTEIVSEGEKKIMPDIQRHMREELGINPTQLSSDVSEFRTGTADDYLRTMNEIVTEGEKKLWPDMQRYMREDLGIDPTQLSSDVSEFRTGTAGFRPGTSDSSELGRMAVEDNTEAVREYSDEEIKEHIRKLDEEREKRIKLLNQQEQDRAKEFRQFQSRLNEAARSIQQSTVEQLDKRLTQQGYDTSKFRTGTAGFRPGTSDLGEMGKMFGDKSIGDTSKSDDKGRHL